MIPVLYYQTDKRWSDTDYSAPGEKTTIGKAGCGPTCAAMVIASLADPTVTPVQTAAWALEHNYKAYKQGTYYSYFVPQLDAYGIKCSRINTLNIYKLAMPYVEDVKKSITNALSMGHWVIACMGKGTWTSSGHFVLAYKTDGTNVYIHDPASSKSKRIKNTLEHWESEIKYAWEVIPQSKKEEDDEMVEIKKMAILGKDVPIHTIFKDGVNYVAIRDLCEAMGYKVSSDGSTPIVNHDVIKVRVDDKTKAISGVNSDGKIFVGIRVIGEMLGAKVSWDDREKVVVIE